MSFLHRRHLQTWGSPIYILPYVTEMRQHALQDNVSRVVHGPNHEHDVTISRVQITCADLERLSHAPITRADHMRS